MLFSVLKIVSASESSQTLTRFPLFIISGLSALIVTINRTLLTKHSNFKWSNAISEASDQYFTQKNYQSSNLKPHFNLAVQFDRHT